MLIIYSAFATMSPLYALTPQMLIGHLPLVISESVVYFSRYFSTISFAFEHHFLNSFYFVYLFIYLIYTDNSCMQDKSNCLG